MRIEPQEPWIWDFFTGGLRGNLSDYAKMAVLQVVAAAVEGMWKTYHETEEKLAEEANRAHKRRQTRPVIPPLMQVRPLSIIIDHAQRRISVTHPHL